MSDETVVEKEVESLWKRYRLVAVIIAAFSGGSITAVFTFATDWVDMNSRPHDVMIAADLAPNFVTMIQDNQNDIQDIKDFICSETDNTTLCGD